MGTHASNCTETGCEGVYAYSGGSYGLFGGATMGKALRRTTFRKGPRVIWWGIVAWTVLGFLFVMVALGFVYVFTVAFS
jgi:hypothetical protein